MKLYAFPLLIIPVAIFLFGGATGAVATHFLLKDKVDSPPYEDPLVAYNNYVTSVEIGDYKGYQWAVKNPMSEEDFNKAYEKRESGNFARIEEGPGDISIYKKGTEGRAKALSPWDRKEKDYVFIKQGASWKVIE